MAMNVNKLLSAGCKVTIWISDLFAMLNYEMRHDLNNIDLLGLFCIHVLRALGVDVEEGNVELLWASKEIMARFGEYFLLLVDIAAKNPYKRFTR